MKDKSFKYDYCSESLFESEFFFQAIQKETYCLALEKGGRKSARVKIWLTKQPKEAFL